LKTALLSLVASCLLFASVSSAEIYKDVNSEAMVRQEVIKMLKNEKSPLRKAYEKQLENYNYDAAGVAEVVADVVAGKLDIQLSQLADYSTTDGGDDDGTGGSSYSVYTYAVIISTPSYDLGERVSKSGAESLLVIMNATSSQTFGKAGKTTHSKNSVKLLKILVQKY
jgi:hypothetical protein